jgi:hypothetical protein
VWRVIREVEVELLQSGKFSLPSKRVLEEENVDIEYIVVDATEVPIQRPKKGKEGAIVGRKSNTQ